MILKQIDIHNLRNITTLRTTLASKFNFVIGPNGGGKTSFLEALYLLSTGHSFRTRETSPLIQHGRDTLTVFARTTTDEAISIQKAKSGITAVNLNYTPCRSSSELARFLPSQIVYQDIFNIMDAGPSVRRALMDWGLFHVKRDYHGLWKELRRVLKQRNALLRQKAAYDQVHPWDKQLADLSNKMDALREPYVDRWNEIFRKLLAQLTDVPCSLAYFKGWDKKKTGCHLLDVLHAQFESDKQRQYTQSGAQQADLVFVTEIAGKPKQMLSRGQQKIILIALKLAQARLADIECLYLFDDLTAELDAQRMHKLAQCLNQINGQFIITAIDEGILPYFATFDNKKTIFFEQGALA